MKFSNLWLVVRKLLLFSHGQASVERGFSLNKHLMVENQQKDNLIGRRIIKDAINYAGGRNNIDVTDKKMVKFVRLSYSRYMNHLLQHKEKEQQEKVSAKRKLEEEAAANIKQKKIRLEVDIAGLEASVKFYAE